MLRSKYKVSERVPENIVRGSFSIVWCGIAKVLPLLRENLCWSIGIGSSIRCWEDSWIPKVGPLKALASSAINPIWDYFVKDMVAKNGRWNLQAFRERQLEEVKKIVNIPPLHPLAALNKIFSSHTTNGGFSVKSTYRMIKKTHGMHEIISGSLFGSIKAHIGFGFSYG